MTFRSICTLQVRMSQLRHWWKNWNLEFWRKKNLKMIVNREDQQLCFFLDYLDFYARFKKKHFATTFLSGNVNFLPKPRLLKSNLWLRRKMNSTIEMSDFYWYLSKKFGILGFWFKQWECRLFIDCFSQRWRHLTEMLNEQNPTMLSEQLYVITYRNE